MMYSVEPESSAACTTSHGTSGMDDDAQAGMLRADVLDLPHREPRVHRAVALPEDHARALDRVRLEAAPDLVRIPDDHLVERHAHLVGGVAAEMLIGQEQNPLAALPRPLQRRRRVRRRADDAAVLAAERFDRGGGIDVGDRDDRRRSGEHAHLLEIAPAQLELIGRGHVGHRAAGREVRQDHLLMSALSTSALSAMKCTPQKTMNSASGCWLTCPASLNESPV